MFMVVWYCVCVRCRSLLWQSEGWQDPDENGFRTGAGWSCELLVGGTGTRSCAQTHKGVHLEPETCLPYLQCHCSCGRTHGMSVLKTVMYCLISPHFCYGQWILFCDYYPVATHVVDEAYWLKITRCVSWNFKFTPCTEWIQTVIHTSAHVITCRQLLAESQLLFSQRTRKTSCWWVDILCNDCICYLCVFDIKFI